MKTADGYADFIRRTSVREIVSWSQLHDLYYSSKATSTIDISFSDLALRMAN